jgi:hypothetical protein
MGRPADIVTGVRLALALSLAAVLATVVPTALTAESPPTLVIASLALVAAGLVGVCSLVVGLPALSPAHRIARSADRSPLRPGHVTDPVHHPIRPRAPGI